MQEDIKKFEVQFLDDAVEFLDTLDDKVRTKILYNIDQSTLVNDPKLFKKLDGEIWEFRTAFNGIQYRFLAFWDKRNNENTLVIATHGFKKKVDKVPKNEISRAKELLKKYFEL